MIVNRVDVLDHGYVEVLETHRGDGRPTCIQAMANGRLPTCLDCFFEGGHIVPASVFS